MDGIVLVCIPGSTFTDAAWVRVDGHDAMLLSRQHLSRAYKSDMELYAEARQVWAERDRHEAIAADVSMRSGGRHVWSGNLPDHDVLWTGKPGYYVYTLKDRRKAGKYQVLVAVKI